MAVDVVQRALVVWCPDWSVAATQLPMSEPVAVLQANRVSSCSYGARQDGVSVGLRRREAQARCPQLIVVDHSPERDARMFEPVVVTVEAMAPRVEIIQPGLCAVPTRGPSRYFGGDEALISHTTLLVKEALRNSGIAADCNVGIADGVFAATLAAPAGLVIPPDQSPGFLSPQPIDVLDRLELVDLLKRLGIRTLGDFAALPAADVMGRFGLDGAVAHRLAQGLDEQPFYARTPPQQFEVFTVFEPPVQRVDSAAFAAKTLASQLHEGLAGQGLFCTRVVIESETEHGETLSRIWRHDGRLTAAAIGERVRWQLDGWLAGGGGSHSDDDGYEPTGGLTLLRLTPDGLLPDNGRQLGFWGGSLDADERTARALTRVQGLLGEDGVVTAVLGGGRSPAEQVRLVPWGVAREPARAGHPAGLRARPEPFGGSSSRKRNKTPAEVPSWPGQLPAPSPATVYQDGPPAVVVDADGRPVSVNGRGIVSAAPHLITVGRQRPSVVTAWAGPWLIDERWWDADNHHRKARLQVQTEDGQALLLALEQSRWSVEACYD